VLTIGVVLAVAIGSVGVLQYFLFQAAQYRAIDQRLEATASLLLSSRLSTAELKEFEETDDIIEDVVGGERLNQFVIIYDKKGVDVYRSKNAYLLPDDIATKEKWQTLDVEGNYVRVLTLPLAGQARPASNRRTIQVGLIVSEDLLRWRSVGQHIAIYGALILVLVLLTTVILSQSLLAPLTDLAGYLRFLARRFDPTQTIAQQGAAPSPPRVRSMRSGEDEFSDLVLAAEAVNETIALNLKRTQAWTAQMAHELKTPLTILRNSLDRASRAEALPDCQESVQEAIAEVSHLNRLISGFLEWTAAESYASGSEELHAIRLGAAAREIAEKIGRDQPGRVRLEGDSSELVFARPGFVEQAISNLIVNGLKYSPQSEPVIVRLRDRRLEIEDRGPGIPEEVVARLGQPFNYGRKGVGGFGLGLAWVSTICHKYGWTLSFERGARDGAEGGGGAIARIDFPSSDA
jgi:signal transduction histidine kinase